MTLVEFLTARLDEDESELGVLQTGAESAGPNGVGWAEVGAISEVLMVSHRRALAEVEAKRRIVEIHHPHDHGGEHGDAVFCNECQWDHGDDSPRIDNQPVEGFGTHPCPTLRALASVYADHPGYREEWRP